MRKIKFRAWNKHEKKFSGIQFCASFDADGAVNVHYHCELNQFTGLLDKNGKEVYEGDIVEFDKTEWGGSDNIHIVSWDEKDAAWCFGGGGASSDMEWRAVIGNIYENPELLPDWKP